MAMGLPLCKVCETLKLENLKYGFDMGSLAALTARKDVCRLCHHVYSSYSPTWREELLSLKLKSFPSIVLRAMIVDGMMKPFVSARLSPLESSADKLWMRLFVTSDSPPAVCKFIRGGAILAPDSHINFVRVRTWLSTCLDQHSNCRKTVSGAEVDDADFGSVLPTRVIEVRADGENPRLVVSEGRQARYIALSYCWGADTDGTTLKTDSSNLESFMEEIPIALLPKTLKDAIVVTRELGVEFLWVDRICIVQDDLDDWLNESEKMGNIFQRALCTIAATAAENSNAGLFTDRAVDQSSGDSSLQNLCVTKSIQLPCSMNGYVMGNMFLSEPNLVEGSWVDGKMVCEEFWKELSECEWARRGWVVQERLLSRRIIHYGSKMIRWECQEGLIVESLPNDLYNVSDFPWTKLSMFQRLNRESTIAARLSNQVPRLRIARTVAYLAKDKLLDVLDKVAGVGLGPKSIESFRYWDRVIGIYNTCKLARESDKLPAILGLALEFGTFQHRTYASGLWLEDLSRGLFWYGFKEQLQRMNNSGAPSWSWASWTGNIKTADYISEHDSTRLEISPSFTPTASGSLDVSAHIFQLTCWRKSTNTIAKSLDCWYDYNWWTTSNFSCSIRLSIPTLFRLESEPTNNQDANLFGEVYFDDTHEWAHISTDLESCILTCLVLHTTSVKHVQTLESAYGYFLLIVKEAVEVPGAYERLGVGVCVSSQDRIGRGLLGRAAPKSVVTLV